MTQSQKIYNSFSEAPKTMLMVAKETSIERANICRRISELEERRQIFRIRKGFCKISNHSATYFTTNQNLAQWRQ